MRRKSSLDSASGVFVIVLCVVGGGGVWRVRCVCVCVVDVVCVCACARVCGVWFAWSVCVVFLWCGLCVCLWCVACVCVVLVCLSVCVCGGCMELRTRTPLSCGRRGQKACIMFIFTTEERKSRVKQKRRSLLDSHFHHENCGACVCLSVCVCVCCVVVVVCMFVCAHGVFCVCGVHVVCVACPWRVHGVLGVSVFA